MSESKLFLHKNWIRPNLMYFSLVQQPFAMRAPEIIWQSSRYLQDFLQESYNKNEEAKILTEKHKLTLSTTKVQILHVLYRILYL